MDPSPTGQTTLLSGFASCSPTAAGRAKPRIPGVMGYSCLGSSGGGCGETEFLFLAAAWMRMYFIAEARLPTMLIPASAAEASSGELVIWNSLVPGRIELPGT